MPARGGADTALVARARTHAVAARSALALRRPLAAAGLALAALACTATASGAGHPAARAGACVHRSSYSQGGGSHGSAPRPCSPHRPARGACRDATLRPNAHDLLLVREAVFCLVNRERTRHGEAPLRPNVRLRRAAQEHTHSMVAGGYFEHDGPGGATPLSRLRAVGYISSSTRGYEIGENIGWGTLWLATPRAIVASWMASPGHRANILDRRFRDTAIGVSANLPRSFAHGQPGAIYTQDFGVVIGR
jgi:uncharacterized protein YkwD